MAAGARAQVADEAARLELETRVLDAQIALAGGDEFYLLLDPDARELWLMLKGARLQRFDVRLLQVGTPRVALWSRATEVDWMGVTWTGGALDPPRQEPRVEITPGVESTAVPPTPEEQIAVPDAYRLQFDAGLVIDVVAFEGDERWWGARLAVGLSRWWADARSALWGREGERVRLRLGLDRPAADSLYRSLPPATSLLALPAGLGRGRT
jgi:hypothetical protein